MKPYDQKQPRLVSYYETARIPKGEVFTFASRPHQQMIRDPISGAIMTLAKYHERARRADARRYRP